MSFKIKQLKQELKVLAALIKEQKVRYKNCQRATSATHNQMWSDFWKWERENSNPSSRIYRHKHIAYCLLRGKKYEQIENKVREGNEPNFSYIEQIMKEYREVDAISCGDTVVGNE